MKPGSRLWLGLGAVILLSSPLIEGGTTYLPVTILRLLVLGWAAAWLALGLRQSSFAVASSRGDWWLFAFWTLTAVSLVRSSYPFMTAYWYVNIFVLLVLFYLVLQTALLPPTEQNRLFHHTVSLLLVLASALSVWAIAEFLLGRESRAHAGFFNPNGLAGYLLALSPFALSRILWPAPRPTGNAPRRRYLIAAYLVALVLMLAAVLCTRSRAVVVGFLSLGLLLFLRWRGKAFLLLLLGLVCLTAIPNPLRERMLTLRHGDPYAWERLRIWSASLEMIRDHPTGVGLGLFKYYYPRYSRPVESVKVGRYEKSAGTAHSELLHLAAELSPLAPLLLLGFLLPLVSSAFLHFRPPPLSSASCPDADGLAAAGGLLAISAHSLIDANLHETAIAVLAAFLAAMLSARLGPGARHGVRVHDFSFHYPRVMKVLLFLLVPLLGAGLVFISVVYALTEAYAKIPRLDERIQKLARLAPYNPGYAPLSDYLSLALFQQAKLSGEVRLLEKAIQAEDLAWKHNPNNYRYAEGLGVLYLESAKWLNADHTLLQAAEHYFRRALSLYPHHPFLLHRVAEIYRLRGQWPEEEKWLQEALAREPYYFQARAELALGLLRHGEEDASRTQFEILASQRQEINVMVKKQPGLFGTPYQRQLLYLPAEQWQALAGRFGSEAGAGGR